MSRLAPLVSVTALCAGLAAWTLTGDWRWAVIGLLVMVVTAAAMGVKR